MRAVCFVVLLFACSVSAFVGSDCGTSFTIGRGDGDHVVVDDGIFEICPNEEGEDRINLCSGEPNACLCYGEDGNLTAVPEEIIIAGITAVDDTVVFQPRSGVTFAEFSVEAGDVDALPDNSESVDLPAFDNMHCFITEFSVKDMDSGNDFGECGFEVQLDGTYQFVSDAGPNAEPTMFCEGHCLAFQNVQRIPSIYSIPPPRFTHSHTGLTGTYDEDVFQLTTAENTACFFNFMHGTGMSKSNGANSRLLGFELDVENGNWELTLSSTHASHSSSAEVSCLRFPETSAIQDRLQIFTAENASPGASRVSNETGLAVATSVCWISKYFGGSTTGGEPGGVTTGKVSCDLNKSAGMWRLDADIKDTASTKSEEVICEATCFNYDDMPYVDDLVVP
eukprot:TRINITY_DN2154_c0_g1_i1.p1 TRINITY_DN2154_c0_g1~~TRINITY_DN2154_c0_g1_i1.p1  ORF type:complete len:431 (+),score=58.82 TRINITY_DN2154_c0_g1_i1:112-1293(+)